MMQLPRSAAALLGLALLVWACRDQPAAPDVSSPGTPALLPTSPGLPPHHLALDKFTVEDGLCANTITALYQDRQGFLWIGTEGGLNRYDGHRFQAYRHEDTSPNSLAVSEILAVSEDSKDNLWILHPNGLSKRTAQGDFTYFSDTLIQEGLGRIDRQLTIDRRDRIWFKRQSALFCFDIAREQFIRAGDYGAVPFQRQDGSLYLFAHKGRDGDPITRHSILKWTEAAGRFDIIWDTTIDRSTDHFGLGYNAGAFDGAGNLWFCRQDGNLLHYDFNTGAYQFVQAKPDAPARYKLGSSLHDLCYSRRENTLWLASFNGLIRYDLSPGAAIPIIRYEYDDQDPQGLPVRVAGKVLEDRAGNLWVGTMGGGLCRYSPGKNKFRVFKKNLCDPAGMAGNKVEALCFDGKGRLWAGTDQGLSLLENPIEGAFRNFYHPPAPGTWANVNWITDLACDTAGERLYLSYWGNVPDLFDTRHMQFRPLRPANMGPGAMDRWLRSPYIPYTSSVERDQQGNIWYGAYGEFVQKYAPASGHFTFFGWRNWDDAMNAGLLSGLTTVAYPTRDGVLWLGTEEDKGINRFDIPAADALVWHTATYNPLFPHAAPAGTLTAFRPNAADTTTLRNGVIHDMLEGEAGRLWIATNHGLHLLKDRERGIFQHFGAAQGLPDEVVQCLEADARGRLWLGTNKGLCCFDPEAQRVIARYDVEDGLPDNAFLPRACARSPRGELAFGTARGFCLFHPDSLFHNPLPPSLALSSLEVNGILRPTGSAGLTLEHTDKNLVFEFAVLDFSNPRKNRYQYYLEGFDAGWRPPSAEHRAIYTNLPPGAYTFRVRGCQNDGVWSTAELAFPLVIRAPWWARWWFRALVVLMALAAITLAVWYRERQLLRKQQAAERLIKYLQVQTLQAQINPHFIFNVLGAMQNQILNSNAREANRHLVSLAKLIRRFLDSSVSSAPPGKGMSGNEMPLEQEIELLRLYVEFEQLQRPGKFEYALEVEETVNPHNAMIPPMIIQPYVENAVKHGLLYKDGPGRLDIRFFKAGEGLACRISDDGVGREKAAEIQARSHKLYKSYGTRLVRERVDILNEMGHHIDIQTEDRPGGGTTVLIKFME